MNLKLVLFDDEVRDQVFVYQTGMVNLKELSFSNFKAKTL